MCTVLCKSTNDLWELVFYDESGSCLVYELTRAPPRDVLSLPKRIFALATISGHSLRISIEIITFFVINDFIRSFLTASLFINSITRVRSLALYIG